MTTPNSRPALLGQLIRALPALAIIALAGWGLWKAGSSVFQWATQGKSEAVTAIVLAGLASFGSVLTLVLGKVYEWRGTIQNDLRQKKTPVYEDITKMLFGIVFHKILKGSEMPRENVLEFFATTTERITIWGSDEVLKAYTEFKTQSPSDTMNTIYLFESLLLAIRKDLGHRNRGIGKGAILKLFVNNIEEYAPPH